MGLSPPTEEVAQEANEIKKQVLNGMIANLVDEMELHPMDIIAERRASGKTSGKDVTKDELLCDPANHYATMHKRSVTATVSGNYWVRTAQLKGMTMYAREHVFLLDVMADGVARVQLYAYREQVTKYGELVEIGTVTTLSTEVELQIFRELKAHDIFPLVLVLWWQEEGNHFQAVTYPADRYLRDSKALSTLIQICIAIMLKHGNRHLEPKSYDSVKTARSLRRW
ncbi:hypothetical protein PC120_g19314 [Phytophthora cactorum]|nr:hypothetical protein PC120_g19314 [Phytophthora cactorum]